MQQLEIDTSRPVLVTGASGYVAGWLVQRLLEEGLTVHAAVRDPAARDKLRHLDALAERLGGRLHYFKADLLQPDSYDAAMAGCSVVFHTASPFTLTVRDAQRELVEPALAGTRNVLASVARYDSVTRVVLTSSCAAIYGDNADVSAAPGGVLTEEVWNSSSSLTHQPYSYSKTVAERAAWEAAQAQSRWRLVVINPSLVIGPGVNPHATSESFHLVRQLGDGTLKMGVPDYPFGAVDVRDVAEAHLRAAFLPQASGRHIVSAHETSLLQLSEYLQPRYGQRYPLPRKLLPKWLVWLVGPLADKSMTRAGVARNVGWPWRADHSKSRRALGLDYRPLSESVNDMFQQLIDSGQLPRKE